MKSYNFPDPDYDEYEITVPKEVVKDIVIDYLQKTFYWSVAIFSFIIGFLVGVIVK
jgi:hypothetical protein